MYHKMVVLGTSCDTFGSPPKLSNGSHFTTPFHLVRSPFQMIIRIRPLLILDLRLISAGFTPRGLTTHSPVAVPTGPEPGSHLR